jgi:hypothetical protein
MRGSNRRDDRILAVEIARCRRTPRGWNKEDPHMRSEIGFVLLSHRNPKQVLRLISTLNRMFDNPRIACHHDFSQSAFHIEEVPDNVTFVRPHIQTSWANFSVIDAAMSALRLLYEDDEAPERFVLLSGQCYPIKSADLIMATLNFGQYDAQIRYTKIDSSSKGPWSLMCNDRYCLRSPFYPFSDGFYCFAGSHWFSANKRVANQLIDFHVDNALLAQHYRYLEQTKIIAPEESYYHTILCNSEHLKIHNSDLRYTDWSRGGSHPKTLTMDDLEKIIASPAIFARKIEADDSDVLDEIDRTLYLVHRI